MNGVGRVLERGMFYRDQYRKMTSINLGMLVLVLALSISQVVMVFALLNKDRVYFATSPNGSIIQMIPLSEPSVSVNRMLQVAGDAATCVFTYDHLNYRSQLMQCNDTFTDTGWMNFTKELSQSKILKLVTGDQLVVSATRIKAPVVVDSGVVNGRLAWKVEVPIRVTFTGRGASSSEDYVVIMTVVRISQTDNVDGVGIDSFIATKG